MKNGQPHHKIATKKIMIVFSFTHKVKVHLIRKKK